MSLYQIIAICWARKFIILVSLFSVIAGAGVAIVLLPERYTASASLILDLAEPNPVTGQVIPSVMVREYRRTQMTLLQSDSMAEEVVNRLALAQDPTYQEAFRAATGGTGDITRWIAGLIKEGVSGVFAGGGNVMLISYTAASPNLAAVMANTYMAVFVDEKLAMEVGPAERNLAWYESQIDELQREYEQAVADLIAFRTENEIIEQSGAEVDVEAARLLAMSEELVQLQTRLIALRSQETRADETIADSAAGSDSPLLQLRFELMEVESEIARLRSEVGPNHPSLAGLNSARALITEQIAAAQETARVAQQQQIASLLDQIAAVEGELATERSRMLDLQGQRESLEALSREVEFRQQQLDSAGARAATLRLETQQSSVNVTPLDSAVPPTSPTFPKKRTIAVLAVGAGGGLGLVLAILFEFVDRRIRTMADLDHATKLRPLGSLASAKSRRRLRSRSLPAPNPVLDAPAIGGALR